jgi:hypothetical protein
MKINNMFVKIGVIISVYNEYENVMRNIRTINKNLFPIVLIQSDPNDLDKIIDSNLVNYYQMFPDIVGTENLFTEDAEKTISHPLSRNISHAFTVTSSFDADWWIVLLGDMKIHNFDGIEKIIGKMESQKKSLAITREIGLTFTNKFGKHGKVEKSDSHNFVPTFFIVSAKLVKKGIFQNIKVTNPFAMEECMGDAATKFFNDNNYDFFEQCYIIADYAYPKFIEGLEYNKDRTILPRYVDGIVNAFRRFKTKFY